LRTSGVEGESTVFVGTYFENPWLEVRIISEHFHAGERTEKGGIPNRTISGKETRTGRYSKTHIPGDIRCAGIE
jgi:hypothetical protein